MMIVQCDACKYTFKRAALPHRCPDCGAFAVRPASEEEIAEYQKIQKELMEEGWFDDATSIRADYKAADCISVDTVALGRIAV